MVQVRQTAFLPEICCVLVTGAASGIGYAQAEAFLQKNHRVFAVDIQPPTKSVQKLKATYSCDQYYYMQADVSQKSQVDSVFSKYSEWSESLNIVCNTAGILDEYHTLAECELEDWKRVMDVNITSMFLVTKQALPLLLKQKSSRVINMASIASLTGGGGGIAYTTSKHAVAGFTKQLAYDYSNQGLRCNAIAPGAIATVMNEADFIGDQKMAKWVEEETPVKRWAQASEVADLTLFLASNESDYIQGSVIPLDGGWLIR